MSFGIIPNGQISNANLGNASARWADVWATPATTNDVIKKYFEVKGDVKTYAKEFMDIISRLYGVDDNFKVIKLYGQLRKGLQKEFIETAEKFNKLANGYAPAYSFSNDTDTGIYLSGSNTISFSVGADNSDTDKLTIK